MTWYRCPTCGVEYAAAANAAGCCADRGRHGVGMFHVLGARPPIAGAGGRDPGPTPGEPTTYSALTPADRHRILRNSPSRRDIREQFRRSLRNETRHFGFDHSEAPWSTDRGPTGGISPDPEGGWVPC